MIAKTLRSNHKTPASKQRDITLTLQPKRTEQTRIAGSAKNNKVAASTPKTPSHTKKRTNTSQITQEFFDQSDNRQWLSNLNKDLKQKIEQHNKSLASPYFRSYRLPALKEEVDQMAKHCFATTACREALEGSDFSKILAFFPFMQHPGHIDSDQNAFEQAIAEYWQQRALSNEPSINLHQ